MQRFKLPGCYISLPVETQQIDSSYRIHTNDQLPWKLLLIEVDMQQIKLEEEII